jgi:hypothetical protein
MIEGVSVRFWMAAAVVAAVSMAHRPAFGYANASWRVAP